MRERENILEQKQQVKKQSHSAEEAEVSMFKIGEAEHNKMMRRYWPYQKGL